MSCAGRTCAPGRNQLHERIVGRGSLPRLPIDRSTNRTGTDTVDSNPTRGDLLGAIVFVSIMVPPTTQAIQKPSTRPMFLSAESKICFLCGCCLASVVWCGGKSRASPFWRSKYLFRIPNCLVVPSPAGFVFRARKATLASIAPSLLAHTLLDLSQPFLLPALCRGRSNCDSVPERCSPGDPTVF